VVFFKHLLSGPFYQVSSDEVLSCRVPIRRERTGILYSMQRLHTAFACRCSCRRRLHRPPHSSNLFTLPLKNFHRRCTYAIYCICFMSVSHFHDPSASSQNVGNHVGNRPCVRQSQLFRRNESGNAMKELMGQSCLQWDTKKLQGAYSGAAYDPNSLKVMEVVQCEPFYPSLLYSPLFVSHRRFFCSMCTCKFRNIATTATQPTVTAANSDGCRRAIAALHSALVNIKHLPEGRSRRETRTCS
jgi:hypothetical protein